MKAYDQVEIIDPSSASRVRARVESVTGDVCILRLEQAAHVPGTAPVRWFDGVKAWQATAHLEQIDTTQVSLPPHARGYVGASP